MQEGAGIHTSIHAARVKLVRDGRYGNEICRKHDSRAGKRAFAFG